MPTETTLTRDDLARLRHGKHVAETYGSMDSIRAYHRDLAECADALLAYATEALDRRDGLVFVRVARSTPNNAWRALAQDGEWYEIIEYRGAPGRFSFSTRHDECGDFDSIEAAIEQARAHDKARRGGK